MVKVIGMGAGVPANKSIIATGKLVAIIALLCLMHAKAARGESGSEQVALAQPTANTPQSAIYVTNSESNTVTVFRLASKGNAPPAASIGDPLSLTAPGAIAIDSNGNIYVADLKGNNVRVYARGASSAAAPIATIGGAKTQLDGPSGIAIDPTGKVYVSNSAAGNLTVYAALGSRKGTLNEAPLAVISGANTGLLQDAVNGIALDSAGNIYVANSSGGPSGTGSILIFGSLGHSTGTLNESPLASISGSNTGLQVPTGIALDSNGNIYVLQAFDMAIYSPLGNATGILNEAPLETLTSSAFNYSDGIALDHSGNIYVANFGPQNELFPGSIIVIPVASVTSGGGEVTPVLTITGENTGLSGPLGIALDAGGNIYATNEGSIDNGVVVYPPLGNSAGVIDEAPASTLGISLTGLIAPRGIALDSSANIYVANADGGALNNGSVTIFPAGSRGNVTPTATIAFNGGLDLTGLSLPEGLALDVDSNVYATNAGNYLIPGNDLTIYPALGDSIGTLNEAPMITIGGSGTSQTELAAPSAIALDTAGRIYVTNSSGGPSQTGSVTVYSSIGNSAGTLNEAPIASISGADTALSRPDGIALDSTGNIYVANFGEFQNGTYGPSSITVYPSTVVTSGGGDVKPLATISGSNTQLNGSSGIALDMSGNVYVTNFGKYGSGSFSVPSITVYSGTAVRRGGNLKPIATISGSKTTLDEPGGITIGSFAP